MAIIESIHDSAAAELSLLLGHNGQVGKALGGIVRRGAVRTLEARMIIEGGYQKQPIERQLPPLIERPLGEFPQTPAIEHKLELIRKEGFQDHFHELIGLFGAIMMTLSGSKEQQAWVQDWVASGLLGTFLMTDAGGPSLAAWKSEVVTDADGAKTLVVDKWHGIAADKLGFGLITARQGSSPIPVIFLVSPEKCAKLEQTPAGESWLSGRLMLGNVKGSVPIEKKEQMVGGGLTGVNKFLTLCRPRFVRGLMAHVAWLVDQQRATPSAEQTEAVENLAEIARRLTTKDTMSRDSVDEVLAIKFASNEVLLDLVVSGAIPKLDDQRDLLGFTKMEGSSYRCFFEIESKRRPKNESVKNQSAGVSGTGASAS